MSATVWPIYTTMCLLQIKEARKGIETSTRKSNLSFAENQLPNLWKGYRYFQYLTLQKSMIFKIHIGQTQNIVNHCFII